MCTSACRKDRKGGKEVGYLSLSERKNSLYSYSIPNIYIKFARQFKKYIKLYIYEYLV